MALKKRKQRGEALKQSKAESMVARLLSITTDLKYGSVSVTAKIHNGRVSEITYSTTESTREAEQPQARKTETCNDRD